MMDLPAAVVVQGGASGVLLIAVVLVLLGRFWPARQVDKMLAEKDKEINRWQKAYDTEVQRGNKQAEQLDLLVELGRTTVQALSSLPRPKDPVL